MSLQMRPLGVDHVDLKAMEDYQEERGLRLASGCVLLEGFASRSCSFSLPHSFFKVYFLLFVKKPDIQAMPLVGCFFLYCM